ncbi:serine/threonine protein kinase [Gigaspora margarita]|uniref:Serine/threonine protein kinase n=1 Tax=Gigaspora margarita TaxID=4874 RepID=A0A8H4A776_GIGMA|nr:serine/threonine protein kinase [Gigaspora margarita]
MSLTRNCKPICNKQFGNDKIVDTNSVDIDNNGDESDEWNTLHVNDYQNWLYNFDIMRDYSEEKIASIVNKNIPNVEEKGSTNDEEKKLNTNEETKQSN